MCLMGCILMTTPMVFINHTYIVFPVVLIGAILVGSYWYAATFED